MIASDPRLSIAPPFAAFPLASVTPSTSKLPELIWKIPVALPPLIVRLAAAEGAPMPVAFAAVAPGPRIMMLAPLIGIGPACDPSAIVEMPLWNRSAVETPDVVLASAIASRSVHVVEPDAQLNDAPLPSADELTVITLPAVALAVFDPPDVTLIVTAAALSSVPVPFGPLHVIMRKLSSPYVAPTERTHVKFGLPVQDDVLKICGGPPLTLTVIETVADEIVCGFRTAELTIRVALEVVVDEPAPGIVSVNCTFPLPPVAPLGIPPPLPVAPPPRNEPLPLPPPHAVNANEITRRTAQTRNRTKKNPPPTRPLSRTRA